MTDEERKEAERLGDELTQSCWCAGPTCSGCEANTRKLALKIYAAACEAKQAEVHKHKTAAAVFREMIEAERARSAKLASYYLEAIAALDATETSVSLVEDMRKALAKYEAARD